MALWSWRVLSSLWWRETVWLCTAETRRRLPTSQLISIRMASSWEAALQEKSPSTVFPSLMKDSTSVTSLMLENHQRADWLSEVKHCKIPKIRSKVCFLNNNFFKHDWILYRCYVRIVQLFIFEFFLLFHLLMVLKAEHQPRVTLLTHNLLTWSYSRFVLLSLQLLTERRVPPQITPSMFSCS